MDVLCLNLSALIRTPVRHVASKCDSQRLNTLPETRDKEIACCPARRARAKQQQKMTRDKFLDVH